MPWWVWLIIILVALWIVGYMMGPLNGRAVTKRDEEILRRRTPRLPPTEKGIAFQQFLEGVQSHEVGPDPAFVQRLRTLRDVPMAGWTLCPRCGTPLDSVEGTDSLKSCPGCPTAYSDPGVKPVVAYAASVRSVVGFEEYLPVLPSELHRKHHPNIWVLRPADLPASIPDVLGDIQAEMAAYVSDQ